jgi:galactokinase
MNSLFWSTWPLRVPAYGACMTGRGFDGCTGNLVRTDCAAAFKAHIARTYEEATGITPDSYVCERAQGAHAWPVERSVEG